MVCYAVYLHCVISLLVVVQVIKKKKKICFKNGLTWLTKKIILFEDKTKLLCCERFFVFFIGLHRLKFSDRSFR